MRRVSLLFLLSLITTCYALKVLSLSPETDLEPTDLPVMAALLPVKSEASAGVVTRQALNLSFSNPLFIVGDDARSRHWLKDHAHELQALNAVGFVTNIRETQALEELQALAQLPLLPATVDDLMSLLKTDHYPLLFDGREVRQ